MTSDKTELAIARADRVMRSLDERDGAVRDAARRERQRLNAGLGRTLARVGDCSPRWVFGRYDRAWGPERPVFGKLRAMTSASAARKLRLREYVARWRA